MDLQEILSKTKDELDAVSPSFCLAKWLQVTLHLQNGFNHSCHHPRLHKIPLKGLEKDPSALHNTPYKKELRAMMKKGERPAECDYCWRVEDTPGSHFSDRVLKSNDSWALPRLKEIAKLSPKKSVNPSYLEVSFGNECNFRCSYCAPNISSSLWSSYEKHGAYVARLTLDQIRESEGAPIPTEKNPYIDAFWSWFPSLVKDLKVFRITGGEPLVNPNTFKVLDYLEANPQPHLQLCINSNLGIPEPHFRKFMEKLKSLTASGKIADFMLFTSIDTHGEQAEFIRTGLKYGKWLERVRTYLRELPWNITYMVTFNTLSVARFPLLLKDLVAINAEFIDNSKGWERKRTLADISHLTHPEYFSPWVLTDRWIREIGNVAAFMETLSCEKIGASGFYDYEIHKMKRIAAWAASESGAKKKDSAYHRALFYVFLKQYEHREGKKFTDIFPEMEDYWSDCERNGLLQGDSFLAHALGPIWGKRAPGKGAALHP